LPTRIAVVPSVRDGQEAARLSAPRSTIATCRPVVVGRLRSRFANVAGKGESRRPDRQLNPQNPSLACFSSSFRSMRTVDLAYRFARELVMSRRCSIEQRVGTDVASTPVSGGGILLLLRYAKPVP
jgi:hypothetical protein